MELTLDGDVSMLRVDPAMDYCSVRITKLLFNGEETVPGRKIIVTNGRTLRDGSYVFATEDPNINIKVNQLQRKAENQLELEMQIVRLPAQIAEDMAAAVKKLF